MAAEPMAARSQDETTWYDFVFLSSKANPPSTTTKIILFNFFSHANAMGNETGLWAEENLTSGVAALSFAVFTRVLGWSIGETEAFLEEVKRDMRNVKFHSYWNM